MLQISPSTMRSRAARIPLRERKSATTFALVLGGIAVMLAIAACVWTARWYRSPAPRVLRLDISPSPPPLPSPLKEGFLPMDRARAELVNAGIAVSKALIEPARPFAAVAADLASRQSAVDCLTAAIYYEAASESDSGQRAVAQVVLNRVRHPAFPKSVCGVVYEGAERRTGCQFSFTCDGSLARKPTPAGWARARGFALAALAGYVEPSVGTATHYHTIWVVPYWAWSLDKIGTLGAHIFYRWPGYWGRRAAFTGVYAGEAGPGRPGMIIPDPLDLSADAMVTGSRPAGPRLLADELGSLSPVARAAAALAYAPRADLERGTLVADETAGALIGSAPKGSSAPYPPQ